MRFREGRAADVRPAYELWEEASQELARRIGSPVYDKGRWPSERGLLEWVGAQPGGEWWVCESEDRLVGYARVAHFDEMDELTDIAVSPAHQGQGVRRGLLERCWPGVPTPQLGRIVVTAGTPRDLNLFTDFGVMPVAGHWYLSQRAEALAERRLAETMDGTEPAVHLLKSDRAVQEWQRLEPEAIGHSRPELHEFFGRTRMCLATVGEDGSANSLCWVSHEGEIGPAVAATQEELIPVVLAALDRVAQAREREWVGVHCTSDSWWLLRRLRRLGFEVEWPSWVLSSRPLPGLARYVPTRPARLL